MNQHSNINTDHLNAQIADDVQYQPTVSSNSGQASAFTNANDVRINNSSLSITNNVNTTSKPTLDELYRRVAPHAISNEGGRADEPKCHPGTREEVIGLLEKWIDAAWGNRILWLSGPAGGGKTAIVKTITESSKKRGVRTINFFFFRADSTRKGAQPVVPTLLYQLFELFPPLSDAVLSILSTRPRILDGSLAEQCKLISKLVPIIRQSLPAGAPVLILVDGLDECDVDAERSQGELIRALTSLVTEDDSPFRLLVASRPEGRIQMAFNQLPSRAQYIFLDEQYSPENDIRVFVTAEFDRIKASHPSARSLKGDWPSPLDVEAIVQKSSGQFIYAATVMRYISHPSTVPSLSLERVQGIVPVANNSPFTHLDSIYAFILAQADDPEATRDMLTITFLQSAGHSHRYKTLFCQCHSRYSQALMESCVSQLAALVRLTRGGDVELYHASLGDFLLSQDRSGVYWIDVYAFTVRVLVSNWEVSPQITGVIHLQLCLFETLERSNPYITHMLLNLPLPQWVTGEYVYNDDARRIYVQARILHSVDRLYFTECVGTYNSIILRLKEVDLFWHEYGTSWPRNPSATNKPTISPAKVYPLPHNWWRKLLKIIRRRN